MKGEDSKIYSLAPMM